MGLNPDEKKLLDELLARDAEPEEEDDFEIEVYDTSQGKGARIPYRKGKGWLHEIFGIGDAPGGTPAEEDGGAGGDAPPAGSAPKKKAASSGTYFGRK
jgi:hypothetical protein